MLNGQDTSTSEAVDQSLEQEAPNTANNVPGAGEDQGETSTPRTYTEEEWNKRQRSLDLNVKNIQNEVRILQQQLLEAQKARDEAENLAFESKFKGASQTEINYAQELIQERRKIAAEWAKLRAEKAEHDSLIRIAKTNVVTSTADKLIHDFGLDEDAKEQLLAEGSPEKMEALAVKLAVQNLRGGTSPTPKKPSKAPLPTRSKQVESGTPMALRSALERAFEAAKKQ